MVIGGVQPIFPSSPPNRYNLDYADVLGQVGYVVYDGLRTNNNATNTYVLIPVRAIDLTPTINMTLEDSNFIESITLNAIYSHFSLNTLTSYSFDFDLSPYLLPVRIRGELLIRFTMQADKRAGKTLTNFLPTIAVKKWDGSTETTIASDSRSAFTWQASKFINVFSSITIPKTNYKIGDQLRISLDLTFNDPAVGYVATLAHNPSDTELIINDSYASTFQAGSTRLIIAVPYIIEQ